jgi:hypothetical protein
MWDGMPRLRAIEARYDSFRARLRPTLAEIVEQGQE